MSRIAIVTDSTACLSAEKAFDFGVTAVPLEVIVRGAPHSEADPATGALLVAALRAHETATTSRPSPEDFAAAYRAAAKAGRDGQHDLDAVADIAAKRSATASAFFYVDTLEYLRRGGRIGSARALLGSALAMKPLLHMADGRVEPLEKVRTSTKAIARLEEIAVERAGGDGSSVEIAVQHLDAAERADALASRLRERLPGLTEVTVCEVGAVIGAHVGPGVLGVVVAPR